MRNPGREETGSDRVAIPLRPICRQSQSRPRPCSRFRMRAPSFPFRHFLAFAAGRMPTKIPRNLPQTAAGHKSALAFYLGAPKANDSNSHEARILGYGYADLERYVPVGCRPRAVLINAFLKGGKSISCFSFFGKKLGRISRGLMKFSARI